MFLNGKNERWEDGSKLRLLHLLPRKLVPLHGEGVKGREEGGWGKFPGPVQERGQAEAFTAELKAG